ncbi:Hypothetical predicted protein [Cloeon dipterum]|uniref:MBD domain-containing protein n=1 Tax=Cloeon dipterum TaxID=197152 RepID=A0A8S1CMK0_9INSE|nr:Hypothetical predicted protein [Cloeon dipterum]
MTVFRCNLHFQHIPVMSKRLSKPFDASVKCRVKHITQPLGKDGWRRRVYLRTTGASAGRKDIVLIAPDETCLRSRVEIDRYCKEHNLTLDPEVYSVSQSKAEHLFKKEIAALIRIKEATKSTPESVARKAKENDKANKDSPKDKVATAAAAAAQMSVAPVKAKRGRPPKVKSVLSERCRNKSGDSASSSLTKKRKHSVSPVKDAKKLKESPNAFTGRQTRNSLATSFSPPKLDNPTGLVTPDSLPSSWKVQKNGDSNLIFVESGNCSLSSLRQLKIYAAKHCISVDLEEFKHFFETQSDATGNHASQNGTAEADIPEDFSEDEEDKETGQQVDGSEEKKEVEEDTALANAEESESLGSELEELASNIFESDDYDVPMDDFETRLQTEEFGLQTVEFAGKEKEAEANSKEVKQEEIDPEIPGEDIKVVNNKDLDKIDPTNFKFFVLPEDDGELPSDSITAADNQCEEESSNEEESHVPESATELAGVQGEPEEEWDLCSPYNLIYESLGTDQWRLLAASIIQPHVSAQVGQVLTLNFLERCPDPASALQLPDPFSLPECEVDPKFAWVLGKLLKLARFLTEGTTDEKLKELIGSYGVAVLTIFGESKLDIVTEEYDLKTYLSWRRNQQSMGQDE